MSAKVIYVDSNIFIAPLLSEDSRRAVSSRGLLSSIEEGAIVAYTSTLTWDEVVWVVWKVLGKADAQQTGEKLLGFPNLRFIAASEDVLRQAQRLVSEHDIAPRDAIHLASAAARGVEVVVSDDSQLPRLGTLPVVDSAAFKP